MSRTLIIAVVALIHLSRTGCFEFFITRNLFGTSAIEKEKWCHVEINQAEGITKNDVVSVKVDIPRTLSFSEHQAGTSLQNLKIRKILWKMENYQLASEVYIFFASDTKEILQVNINWPITGKYYAAPYKFVKEMTGENARITENDDFRQISGDFPSLWLPKNSTKISATVKDSDEQYYNYYGIQNFKISLPDLMVVEEFKSL